MIEIDWTTFQTKFLPKNEIFFIEDDDKWTFYTSHEIWKLKCVVEKLSDQAENMMFIERFFANKPNIIKVISMGEEDEEELEELNPEDLMMTGDKVKYKDKQTSTDDDHYHYYEVDENGNGQTHGTFRAVDTYLKPAHTHIIKDNKILDYNGHTHTYGNQ